MVARGQLWKGAASRALSEPEQAMEKALLSRHNEYCGPDDSVGRWGGRPGHDCIHHPVSAGVDGIGFGDDPDLLFARRPAGGVEGKADLSSDQAQVLAVLRGQRGRVKYYFHPVTARAG